MEVSERDSVKGGDWSKTKVKPQHASKNAVSSSGSDISIVRAEEEPRRNGHVLESAFWLIPRGDAERYVRLEAGRGIFS